MTIGLKALAPLALLFTAAWPAIAQDVPAAACTQITLSDTYGPLAPGWSSMSGAPRLRLPKAVLAEGDTLTEVHLTVTASMDGTLGYENTSGATCVVNPGYQILMIVQPVTPIPGFAPAPFDAEQLLTKTLPPYDGVLDYGGTSGETIQAPDNASFDQQFTLTTDLDTFVDSSPGDGMTEYVELEHYSTGSDATSGSCSPDSEWTATASLTVEVTYSICSRTECPAPTVLQTGQESDEDGSHVLAVLYGLRDKRLAQSERGRELTRLYYAHGPEVHVLMLNRPALRARVRQTLLALVPKIVAGVNGRPATLTRAEVRSADELMADVARIASPDLKRTIEGLRVALKSGELGELAGLATEKGDTTSRLDPR
jgi:hypothetical protein